MSWTSPRNGPQLIDLSRDLVSLDQTVGTDDDRRSATHRRRERTAPPRRSVEDELMPPHLQDVLNTLGRPGGGRGADALRPGRRAAEDVDEIGRAFKLSRERIRQIERETMAKLRHPSRSQALRDYLDT